MEELKNNLSIISICVENQLNRDKRERDNGNEEISQDWIDKLQHLLWELKVKTGSDTQ